MIRFVLRPLFFFIVILSLNQCVLPLKKEYNEADFQAMLQHYWQDLMIMKPLDATVFGDNTKNDQFPNTCTQAYREEIKKFYHRYEDSLENYNPDLMNEQNALSYKVLAYDISNELERAKFDYWKIPFTQMGDAGNTLSANIVLAMGQFGSGASGQPFKTVVDYDNWLKRVHAYTVWCDSAINNFRQGMATGYVLPKTLVVKMIDICNGLVNADDTKSIFYGPINSLPATFTSAEKERLTNEYKSAIKNELNVAHTKMALFLKDEYLPKARVTSGVGDLPGGADYYKFCVKDWTTTNKSLDEIYNTGVSEVKRISREMSPHAPQSISRARFAGG